MKQIGEVREYVCDVLASFLADPPDNDYQRGYEAAYKELLEELQI